jgi:hypothetical protein
MTVADPIRPDIDFALHPLPDLYEILDELRAHGAQRRTSAALAARWGP